MAKSRLTADEQQVLVLRERYAQTRISRHGAVGVNFDKATRRLLGYPRDRCPTTPPPPDYQQHILVAGIG